MSVHAWNLPPIKVKPKGVHKVLIKIRPQSLSVLVDTKKTNQWHFKGLPPGIKLTFENNGIIKDDEFKFVVNTLGTPLPSPCTLVLQVSLNVISAGQLREAQHHTLNIEIVLLPEDEVLDPFEPQTLSMPFDMDVKY